MDVRSLVGKCLPLLFAGLALDVLGLVLLLVGVFADVRAADGQFYGDFFIFTGALVIFLSLAFWVMWYAGNVRVRPGETREARADGLAARLVRKLSESLSRKMAATSVASAGAGAADGDPSRRDARVTCRGKPAADGDPSRPAARVTWGKAAAEEEPELRNYDNYRVYRRENNNEGYDNEGYQRERYGGQEKHDKGYESDQDDKEEGRENKSCDDKEEAEQPGL